MRHLFWIYHTPKSNDVNCESEESRGEARWHTAALLVFDISNRCSHQSRGLILCARAFCVCVCSLQNVLQNKNGSVQWQWQWFWWTRNEMQDHVLSVVSSPWCVNPVATRRRNARDDEHHKDPYSNDNKSSSPLVSNVSTQSYSSKWRPDVCCYSSLDNLDSNSCYHEQYVSWPKRCPQVSLSRHNNLSYCLGLQEQQQQQQRCTMQLLERSNVVRYSRCAAAAAADVTESMAQSF
jgi:hypothetical protein